MRSKIFGGLSALLAAARLLTAHDMWIDPATFFPEPGRAVGLRLRVGQDLLGDPLPRDPALLKQFVAEDAAGRKPVPGRTGADPAGIVRATAPGLTVVGYHSNPSAVEQTAEKFNLYLKEEGLNKIAPAKGPVRELFARCAKTLLLTGAPNAAQGDRTLGFPLELVAERNPYLPGATEKLPVRLMYEGRPLAGTLVVAINRLNPAAKVSARTGRDGRVSLPLLPVGMWLIKAVHIVPAPAGSDAQWLSYWASLTFEKAGKP